MSTSMLSIAFGDVTRSFGISYAMLQLRNVLFFSLFAIGLPLFGKLADRLGARRQFLLGLALFCVASVMSGLAWSWPVFLLFQSLQAVADSMIVPAQMSLIRQLYPEERIGWAFGWFSAVLSVATLIAPAFGGLVVEYFEWRAIFWFLTLSGGAALVCSYFMVPAGREGGGGGRIPLGSALSLLAVVVALQGVLSGAVDVAWRLGALGVLAVGLAGFAVAEHRGRPLGAALIPGAVFRNHVFLVACGRMFLLFLGSNAIALFAPSYMRDVHQLDAQLVGWIVLLEPLIALPAAGFAGRAADRVPRRTIALGIGVHLLGVLLLRWTAHADAVLVAFFVAYALIGLGGTLVSPSQNKLALVSVPREETGHYMGVFQMIQFVSGAFAGSLLGPLMEQEQRGRLSGAGFSLTLTVLVGLQLVALASLLLERAGRAGAAPVSEGGTR